MDAAECQFAAKVLEALKAILAKLERIAQELEKGKK